MRYICFPKTPIASKDLTRRPILGRCQINDNNDNSVDKNDDDDGDNDVERDM